MTVKIECSALVQYDKGTSAEIADELDELPKGSLVRRLVNDYLKPWDICRKIKSASGGLSK